MRIKTEKENEWASLVIEVLCKHDAMIKELARDREAFKCLVQHQKSLIELLKDLVHTYTIELDGYSEGE